LTHATHVQPWRQQFPLRERLGITTGRPAPGGQTKRQIHGAMMILNDFWMISPNDIYNIYIIIYTIYIYIQIYPNLILCCFGGPNQIESVSSTSSAKCDCVTWCRKNFKPAGLDLVN
jgi:hypothetical protein